jgi:hypothetical protein
MFVISAAKRIFQSKFVGIFIIYLHIKLHMSNSNDLLLLLKPNPYFAYLLCYFTFPPSPLVAPTFGSLLLLLEHRAEFPQFLDQGQLVRLLGQLISSSQGLYLYKNTGNAHTYTNIKHPCPEWDLKPRSRLPSK